IVHSPRESSPGDLASRVHFQIETTVDETPQTRFVRILEIRLLLDSDGLTAQHRFALSLSTPAIFEAGPVKGIEPGQLCYHVSDGFGASEIFLRNNVVVSIHCGGPYSLLKRPMTRED